MREEITFASTPVTLLYFFPDRIWKLVLPAAFPWFQSVARDFAERKKKKMLGEHQVSRSFSLFLGHRAGLRDVYFRSVCEGRIGEAVAEFPCSSRARKSFSQRDRGTYFANKLSDEICFEETVVPTNWSNYNSHARFPHRKGVFAREGCTRGVQIYCVWIWHVLTSYATRYTIIILRTRGKSRRSQDNIYLVLKDTIQL